MSRIRSERNTIISIIFLWVVILLTNIPTIIVHGIESSPENERNGSSKPYCSFNKDLEKRVIYFTTFFITSYLLPLILISILYFLMLIRLWKSNISQSLASKRGKRRITRLVLIIVATFAALWFPIQIILFLKSRDMYPTRPSTIALQIIAHILAYASSCVNPLLYAFLSENFRKSFRKVISKNKTNLCDYLSLFSHSQIISLHPQQQTYLPTPTKATATSATNTN